MGSIYCVDTAIPPPETDSFNGGGLIYFKVSGLKCCFIQDVDHQGVTPTTQHHTIYTTFYYINMDSLSNILEVKLYDF